MIRLLFLCLLLPLSFQAQVPAKGSSSDTFIDPELMPEFKGGNRALMRYMQDSVKNKAVISLEESYILRTAYAKFSISETGKVTKVRILRSSNVPHLDSLFKNALEKMPDWTPGSFDGKPKATEMNLPLKLELK